MAPDLAGELQCKMRFDLATIAFAGVWAFNAHAIPVDTFVAWEGDQPANTIAIQPAADAEDSLQLQAMTITELLSTGASNDIDELIGEDDLAFDTSLSANDIHLASLDQYSGTPHLVREAHLPPSHYNYFYFLALVPLGIVGFTILQGWRTWQKDRALDLHASRRARTRRVAT
jgi:hypothetical protein